MVCRVILRSLDRDRSRDRLDDLSRDFGELLVLILDQDLEMIMIKCESG